MLDQSKKCCEVAGQERSYESAVERPRVLEQSNLVETANTKYVPAPRLSKQTPSQELQFHRQRLLDRLAKDHGHEDTVSYWNVLDVGEKNVFLAITHLLSRTLGPTLPNGEREPLIRNVDQVLLLLGENNSGGCGGLNAWRMFAVFREETVKDFRKHFPRRMLFERIPFRHGRNAGSVVYSLFKSRAIAKPLTWRRSWDMARPHAPFNATLEAEAPKAKVGLLSGMKFPQGQLNFFLHDRALDLSVARRQLASRGLEKLATLPSDTLPRLVEIDTDMNFWRHCSALRFDKPRYTNERLTGPELYERRWATGSHPVDWNFKPTAPQQAANRQNRE